MPLGSPRPDDPLSPAALVGRDVAHLVHDDALGVRLVPAALAAYRALVAAAARDGLRVRAASSHRDFASQLRIWNAKARGERPVYDAYGQPLDVLALEPDERIDAILGWSALPGASRHHWGTEVDVYDEDAAEAMQARGEKLALMPAEMAPGGPMHRLALWLEARAALHGFHRPYAEALGGVHPEPWHLSFGAVADRCVARLTVEALRGAVSEVYAPRPAAHEMELGAHVLARLPELHARYVLRVATGASPRGIA
jgi:LAS superfamily LD-carboxypeptidase LdcB